MGGTKEGGKLAAASNKARYGQDYYRFIGSIGGKAGKTGGFYLNRDLAKVADALGGTRSRCGKAKPKIEKESLVLTDVQTHLINVGARAQKRREREQRDII